MSTTFRVIGCTAFVAALLLAGAEQTRAGNGPLPDLEIDSMSIELETGSSCFNPPAVLGVRVRFFNSGNANAGPFVVEVNGAQQTVAGGLQAGESSSLWFSGYQAGSNTAIVDTTDVVIESDEQNNQLTSQPPVPTPPLTCTATPTITGTASPTATQPSATSADIVVPPGTGTGDTGGATPVWMFAGLGALAAIAAVVASLARLRDSADG